MTRAIKALSTLFSVTSSLVLAGVFLSQLALAANESDDVIEQMNLLIAQGQFQQAYTIGQTNVFELEGDAEFDFLYGLAALETGRPNEAVFAFERIA